MDTPKPEENQEGEDLRCRCPHCGAVIDVNRDRYKRPYWVCAACQTRTFGTRTTLDRFTAEGLIWKDEPLAAALEAWWNKVAAVMGLKKKRKR